ncbi:LysR family transcriptional regulator [Halodesulfovibrio spirochaetisodalis]|uniref:LysR family transcriptional regulator n=1 Tax=Halodesulfovibrio spirochaetisodalis TaxID=1560234 RepID=A0A1B7XPT5_9BACT|nr:LysR family transcriptional regulator [Halodesulfovibrio spirochaetisodalis]OBQ57513.1 LysR family transcriptional regulator [Halodesulfovibrio spirochaetisodalis]
MDLRLLRYFIAVFEEHNITRAAQRCHVSQPSISSAIKQLEEMLDVSLFKRSKQGVEITDEAHHLYPRAKRLLEQAHTIEDLFKGNGEEQHLTIGVFPDLSPKRLADVLEKMRKEIPGLVPRLVDFQSECDIRITVDVLRNQGETWVPLWEENYVLCMRPDHELAGREFILPEELHQYDFIECPPCEAHQQTIGLMACSDLRMNIVASGEHKSQVMHLVQAGYGISFLPDGVLETAHDLVTVPLRAPRMFKRVGITYSADKTGAGVVSEVINLFMK